MERLDRQTIGEIAASIGEGFAIEDDVESVWRDVSGGEEISWEDILEITKRHNEIEQERLDHERDMKIISQQTCLRCGTAWYPRSASRPIRCPKCRSPYWDKPRK